MDILEILKNEYFGKILLTLVPIIVKGVFGKDSNLQKYLVVAVNYLIPIATILWLNFDEKIVANKLTITLIAFNFALLIFNYCQQKLTTHYKLISQFTNAETDKIQQINNINKVQVEKMIAINDNQKYILSELSRINDRIIRYFADKIKDK